MRSGESYLKEVKQLRKIREVLNMDYEIDRNIADILRQRRRELLLELEEAEKEPKLKLVSTK